jgi:methanogenic corrinoid protein MtbC1
MADRAFGVQSLEALGIQSALLEGDAGLAYRLVSDLMADGVSFDQILFDVLAPLQRDVGARWLRADYRIAEEHAASAAVETVVALLAGSFDMPEEGTHVVVACAEGDNHSLPARMVAAYLTYLGWRVTFLGATLPADDLGAYLAEERPAALLLSCTATPNLLGARACIQAAHAAGVPVIAGGRAFGTDPARSRAVGADEWVGDPRRLDVLLEGWDPDIAAAEASALTDEEARDLSAALRGCVETAVATDLGGASVATTRSDLLLLGATLVSAVLTDDASLVHEVLEWHRLRRSARDDLMPADDLVELLATHLPASATRAREMLTA